jgi:hypothetical protein
MALAERLDREIEIEQQVLDGLTELLNDGTLFYAIYSPTFDNSAARLAALTHRAEVLRVKAKEPPNVR